MVRSSLNEIPTDSDNLLKKAKSVKMGEHETSISCAIFPRLRVIFQLSSLQCDILDKVAKEYGFSTIGVEFLYQSAKSLTAELTLAKEKFKNALVSYYNDEE